MANSYHTPGREKINEYLKNNADRTVSAHDIAEFLESMELNINLSTIYRYLNKLSEEGTLTKYVAGKGEMAVYQLVSDDSNCHEHLHMQCRGCGRIIHLNCDFMEELFGHVFDHHGFTIECSGSIIYGICEECRDEKASEKADCRSIKKLNSNKKKGQTHPHGKHCECGCNN